MTEPGGLQRAARAIADRLYAGALIVASTGAGMSRESGIPTFRGAEGVWRQYRAEEVATPEALARDPAWAWEFHDHLRALVAAARPNAGHLALARLERELTPACAVRVITQNVDRLHEAAGSSGVVRLHGDILRVVCPRCGWEEGDYPVPAPAAPPHCDCGAVLRPDVVLFGERLPEDQLEEAFALAETCDVMLVVGTSVVVEPAASLPVMAREQGALVVEVNPEPTILSRAVQHSLRGTAGGVLPALVEEVLRLTQELDS